MPPTAAKRTKAKLAEKELKHTMMVTLGIARPGLTARSMES